MVPSTTILPLTRPMPLRIPIRLRNRNTVEFLGVWERLHNPGFNPVEFDGFRIQAGLNSFTLTPK